MVIEVFILIATLLSLLASVYGQRALWFQVAVAALALSVAGWVAFQLAFQLWPKAVGTWSRRRVQRRTERMALILYGEFKDLLHQFGQYADNTRSDNIPNTLNTLRQRIGIVDFPLLDSSLYHVTRLYEAVKDHLPSRLVSAAQLRGLAVDFGNLLELYHRLYVIVPHEKARTYFQLSPSGGEDSLRAELEVQRERYNEYLRSTARFGVQVNETFGEHVFPVHLEPVKPLKS